MSSRTRLSFNVRLNAHGDSITITITDPKDLQADNLALATWGSSIILANVLHRLSVNLEDTGLLSTTLPVIELGAGTGLVGLSAAAVWHTETILTDLPPILSNIEANISLNTPLLAKHGGLAWCGTLDWSEPESLTLTKCKPVTNSSKARFLLAADTVYSEEHPELLVNVIRNRLALESASRVILCYPLRVGYLEHIRDLWHRLEGAGLECAEEGTESIDESWEEDTPYEWCVWRWRSSVI